MLVSKNAPISLMTLEDYYILILKERPQVEIQQFSVSKSNSGIFYGLNLGAEFTLKKLVKTS